MEKRTDEWMDEQTWKQYTPSQTQFAGGYNNINVFWKYHMKYCSLTVSTTAQPLHHFLAQ